jgi:hypothetical protein
VKLQLGLGLLPSLLDHLYCFFLFLPLQIVEGIQTGPASRSPLEALQDTHVPLKLSGQRIPAWKHLYPNKSGQPLLAPKCSRSNGFTGQMARGERYPVLTVQRHVRLLSSDCLTFPPIPACPAGLFCFCCRNLCLNNVCTEILPDQICIVSQQSTCTQPISIFDHIDVIVDLKHGVGWLLKVSKWRLEIFDRCLRLVLFQKSVG